MPVVFKAAPSASATKSALTILVLCLPGLDEMELKLIPIKIIRHSAPGSQRCHVKIANQCVVSVDALRNIIGIPARRSVGNSEQAGVSYGALRARILRSVVVIGDVSQGKSLADRLIENAADQVLSRVLVIEMPMEMVGSIWLAGTESNCRQTR